MTIDEMIAVMTAYRDGKEIQWRVREVEIETDGWQTIERYTTYAVLLVSCFDLSLFVLPSPIIPPAPGMPGPGARGLTG